jgi:hypothetical protein
VNRVAVGAFVALVASQSAVAVEARDFSLTRVAADLGFRYSYLGPEDAVTLTRPGLTVLVRPGEQLYDVNDETESLDGPPPRFSRGDLLVSGAFVARLRELSARFSARGPGARPVIVVTQQEPLRAGEAGGAPSQVTGAITALEVRQIPGAQILAVSGKAPGKLPITLTLVGTFSAELPDVVLSRTSLIADASGTFLTDVSIAPGYYRGAILTVVASSVSGVTSASTQVVAKAPNGGSSIPADEIKPSDR